MIDGLTPAQIVEELDKYIIGQDKAKKSVAIALRNRWRRRSVDDEIKNEILPANIIMMGPTGVGKTEVARRLANLAEAPFLKVEASKFTEVGYVGRDVESMIRDLVEIAITMEKERAYVEVRDRARENATERLLDMLLPVSSKAAAEDDDIEERIQAIIGEPSEEEAEAANAYADMMRTSSGRSILESQILQEKALQRLLAIVRGEEIPELESSTTPDAETAAAAEPDVESDTTEEDQEKEISAEQG